MKWHPATKCRIWNFASNISDFEKQKEKKMFKLKVDISYIYTFTFKKSFGCGKQTYCAIKVYVPNSHDIINCLKIHRKK